MRDVAILLAMPSPLYAPIYLAKVRSKGVFSNLQIEYAPPPKPTNACQSYGGRFSSPGIKDEIFHDLLAKHPKRTTLLAVLDPLRIRHAPRHSGYDEPYVVASLLHKMCYWLIDTHHIGPDVSGKWNFKESFRKLIVHPKGMTGYALAFYDMVQEQGHAADEVAEFLYHAISPGKEWDWYSSNSRRQHPKPIACLTENPILAFQAVHNRSKHIEMVRSYCTEHSYQDVLMTGLVTGQALYKQHQETIDSLVEEIAGAVEFIKANPGEAADDLSSYDDGRMSFASIPPTDLLGSFTLLSEEGVFDPDLEITEDQVRKSLAIRKASEASNPAERPLLDIEGNISTFFRLASKVTPRQLSKHDNLWPEILSRKERQLVGSYTSGAAGSGLGALAGLSSMTLILASYVILHPPVFQRALEQLGFILQPGGVTSSWTPVVGGAVLLLGTLPPLLQYLRSFNPVRFNSNPGRTLWAALTVVGSGFVAMSALEWSFAGELTTGAATGVAIDFVRRCPVERWGQSAKSAVSSLAEGTRRAFTRL